MSLDLTQHEKYIHSLITSWKIPEQDREDYYQDFFMYFTQFAKYDAEKGKPTTFLKTLFKNFMYYKMRSKGKDASAQDTLHIESRDKGYLDRIKGYVDMAVDDEIEIEHILKDVDKVTLDIILGDVTLVEQAKIEGISKQAVQQRHKRNIKKLIGE